MFRSIYKYIPCVYEAGTGDMVLENVLLKRKLMAKICQFYAIEVVPILGGVCLNGFTMHEFHYHSNLTPYKIISFLSAASV